MTVGLGLLLQTVSVVCAQTLPQGPAAVISAERLSLMRGHPEGASLLKPNAGGTGEVTPFSSEDLLGSHRDVLRAGFELSLLGQRLQLAGTTLWSTKGQLTKRPLDSVFPQDAAYATPGADVDVSNSDTVHAMSAMRSTAFWSTEGSLAVDTRRLTGLAVDGLLGVRYMQLRDKLQTIAYDNLTDFQGTTNQIDRASVWARNRLLGPQIGLQGSLPLFWGLSIGGNAKLGYLRNDMTVGSTFTSDDKPDNGLSKSLSARSWVTATEFNPQLTLALGSSIELFAGGTLLRIHGIATADRQYTGVADRDDVSIERSGTTTFHGVTVGAKIKLN